AVLGLENPAHAALAELVENAVLAQQKAGGPPGQDLGRLEAGQPALLHQGTGQHPATVGGGVGPRHVGQLLIAEQTALTQVFQKRPRVYVGNRHDRNPAFLSTPSRKAQSVSYEERHPADILALPFFRRRKRLMRSGVLRAVLPYQSGTPALG